VGVRASVKVQECE